MPFLLSHGYNSQQRLARAFANGWLGDEIVPVYNPVTGKFITKDEHPRPEVTLEKLKSMKSVYEGGVTTAGNASGRNDGASFVLMMTKEKALELGFTPKMKWVTGADEGYYPNLMGVAAAYSNMKAMRQAGLKMSDVDTGTVSAKDTEDFIFIYCEVQSMQNIGSFTFISEKYVA